MAKLPGDFVIEQWLPADRSFLVVKADEVFRWHPGKQPTIVLKLGTLISRLGSDSRWVAACIDPAGSLLAEQDDDGISIVDLNLHKLVLNLSTKEVFRRIHSTWDGITYQVGIAWKADGSAIAVTLPTTPPDDSEDGSSFPQCVAVYRSGRVEPICMGAPVAWLSPTTILCKQESKAHPMSLRPLIWNVRTRKGKSYPIYGWQVGWDGTHPLLATRKAVVAFDANLHAKVEVVPMHFPPMKDVYHAPFLVRIPPTSATTGLFSSLEQRCKKMWWK